MVTLLRVHCEFNLNKLQPSRRTRLEIVIELEFAAEVSPPSSRPPKQSFYEVTTVNLQTYDSEGDTCDVGREGLLSQGEGREAYKEQTWRGVSRRTPLGSLYYTFSKETHTALYRLREEFRKSLDYPTAKTDTVRGIKILSQIPLSMHELLCSHASLHSRFKVELNVRHSSSNHWANYAQGTRTNGGRTFFASVRNITPYSLNIATRSLEHRLLAGEEDPVLNGQEWFHLIQLLHRALWHADAALNLLERLKDRQFIRYADYRSHLLPIAHAEKEDSIDKISSEEERRSRFLTKRLWESTHLKAKFDALN